MEGAQFRVYAWGFLAFQSILWMLIGVMVTAVRYNRENEGGSLDFGDLGTILETGGILLAIICACVPLFFFSIIMLWRNNAEMQTERRHKEMLEAQQQGLPPRQY